MNTINKAILASVASICSFGTSAQAIIKHGNIYNNENTWTVGVGVAYAQEVYRGTDKWFAMFDFGYLSEDFNISNAGIAYRFFGSNDSAFSLSGKLDTSHTGYEASDSKYLRGMKDRDTSYDISLVADINSSFGTLSIHGSHDISGAYKSYNAGARHFLPMSFGKVNFTPSIGLNYFSEKFNQYYYGVEASEVTADRLSYKADSDFIMDVSYNLSYYIRKNLEVVQSSAYVIYGDEIGDSPIVSNNDQSIFSLAVNYYF
ncbi:MipA/OmpV family protein [Vibrio sp. 99-70-13A1]|uniref:MipA/OmpV family protein n=1 Tax=Vibrio sp. 99-70-13A1 TaxID=2607601 RepID=UPI001493D0E3|nr:MipA/OmpV family protein [Vibrio sp. 99-70-13A1]NOH99424.1 MipA/OmpV family protein [Vibrio sp. 99-70-13A1]